jgi:ABC-type polysaccharide/polyol phosphate export permease
VFRNLRALVRYRGLIQTLVTRDLKARYRGSVLGFFWSFINPLFLLLIYSFVFSTVLPRAEDPDLEPYALFMFCGILPWTWFSSSILESSSVLISGGNLIKKVLFPAEVLPVVTVVANLVHFLLGLPILLAFLLAWGKLKPSAFFLPVPLAVQFLLTLGLCLFLSALTVHFRDLMNILGHVLHLWFFATPVLYALSEVPPRLQVVLRLNPMAYVLTAYQQILFTGSFRPGRGLLVAALLAVLVFALGAFVFERLRDTLPEEV